MSDTSATSSVLANDSDVLCGGEMFEKYESFVKAVSLHGGRTSCISSFRRGK